MAVKIGRLIKSPVVTTGNPDTVSDAPVTVTTVGAAYDLSGQLGAVLQTADGEREYIYVLYSGTSTGIVAGSGQPLYWLNRNSTSASINKWTVDTNTTANWGPSIHEVMGVCRATAPARGNYIWALRKGSGIPVVSTSTGMVAGDFVIPSTSSGAASFVASTSTVAGFPGPLFLGIVASTATSSVAITTDLDIE